MRLIAEPTREPRGLETQEDVALTTPKFLVTLDDEELDRIGLNKVLVSAEVLLDDRKADLASITLHNAKEQIGTDALFREGLELEVELGYVDTELLSVGRFITTRPRQLFQGPNPQIRLQALGLEVRLGRDERRKMWFERKDSDIAEEIAAIHSLETDVTDTGRVYERISQMNMTDWEFLQKRAKLYNYTLFVRDGKLHFHPARFEDSGITLKYRAVAQGVLRWVDITVNSFRRAPEVRRSTYDPLTGALVERSNEAEQDSITTEEVQNEISRVRTADKVSLRPVRFQVGGGHTRDEEEVRKQVSALGQSQAYVVSLRAGLIGDARLRPGQTIFIDGIGNHTGRYYLKSVKHSILMPASRGPATFNTEITALRQFVRDEDVGIAQSVVDTSSTGVRTPTIGGAQDITSDLRIRNNGR